MTTNTPTIWQRIKRWIALNRPVRGARLLAAQRAAHENGELACKRLRQIDDLRARHRAELAETTKAVENIVERGVSLGWRRDGERRQYALTIVLDPRMLDYGLAPAREREIMADYVGSRVSADICTARFIHEANRNQPSSPQHHYRQEYPG